MTSGRVIMFIYLGMRTVLSRVQFLVLPLLPFVFCSEMYRFGNDEPLNMALGGQVIKTMSTPYIETCWAKCAWLPWCFSINVRRIYEGMFECELNNSSKEANALKRREGWAYYQMTKLDSPNCNLYECKIKRDLGNGWYRYGNAAIKIFTDKKTWSDARSHCQSIGGDLLSITSSHENDFVNDVFVKPLNLKYFRDEYYNGLGVLPQVWRLENPDSRVLLKGTPGDVEYKTVDDETALYFSGRKGYVHIPAIDGVNPDGFTISYWIQVIQAPKTGYVHAVTLLDESLNLNDLQYIVDGYFTTGDMSVNIKDSANVKNTWSSLRIQPYGTWHHHVISGNKTTGLWLLVSNGTHVTQKTLSHFLKITGNENFKLGVNRQNQLNNGVTLHGMMRDLAIYNKALDPKQIEALAYSIRQGVWIGLSVKTGHFTWSDGSPIVSFNSLPSDVKNPTVSGRDCVMIGNNEKWHDRECSIKNPYICEKRV